LSDSLLRIPTTDTKLPWFALEVNSRKENWISAHLVGQDYECFLPKYKSVRQWSDRRKEIESPLFPGYLFCRFNPLERLPILKTPGVIQIVGCNRSPVPIDEQEIQAIQRMIESGFAGQPWPYLEVGERVRIQSGALRGLEGILISLKGNYRLVLSVTLLKRSVAVEVDASAVQPSRASSTLTPRERVPPQPLQLEVVASSPVQALRESAARYS
jgi:transcription antitermination factor NusG